MIKKIAVHDDDRWRLAYELKASGKTYREIADRLGGISINRARRIVAFYARRNGLPLEKKKWARVSAFRIERD